MRENHISLKKFPDVAVAECRLEKVTANFEKYSFEEKRNIVHRMKEIQMTTNDNNQLNSLAPIRKGQRPTSLQFGLPGRGHG